MTESAKQDQEIPLTEALVRFDLKKGCEWSAEEREQLISILRARYPKEQQQDGDEEHHWSGRDGRDECVAQVRPELLVLNWLAPYRGWGELSAKALELLADGERVRGALRQDLRGAWVCHRRVDLIKGEGSVELGHFLRRAPDWPDKPEAKRVTFDVRASQKMAYEEPRMFVEHQVEASPTEGGGLYLDVMIEVVTPLGDTRAEDLEMLLDKAAERLHDVFEETFTERALFDASTVKRSQDEEEA